MACPYFYPVARFETSSWVVPPRLPLGDAYTGECRAASSAFQPDESRLREVCNVGYGRGSCDRFPEGAGSDAVRFTLVGEESELIRIQYVFEKDCWPQEHGVLECAARPGDISSGPDNPVLRRQAAAFVESYLRRKD
jgi:hypothetical protein